MATTATLAMARHGVLHTRRTPPAASARAATGIRNPWLQGHYAAPAAPAEPCHRGPSPSNGWGASAPASAARNSDGVAAVPINISTTSISTTSCLLNHDYFVTKRATPVAAATAAAPLPTVAPDASSRPAPPSSSTPPRVPHAAPIRPRCVSSPPALRTAPVRPIDAGPKTHVEERPSVNPVGRKLKLFGLGCGCPEVFETHSPSKSAACIVAWKSSSRLRRLVGRRRGGGVTVCKDGSTESACCQECAGPVRPEVSDSDVATTQMMCTGTLTKQGESFPRSWKRRTFVLWVDMEGRAHMHYFVVKGDNAQFIGCINLSEGHAIADDASASADTRPLSFVIASPNRMWKLRTDSQKDKARWMRALSAAGMQVHGLRRRSKAAPTRVPVDAMLRVSVVC